MSENFDQYAHSYLNDPDSELFSADTVTRFSQNGETDFATDFPCIQTRLALSVVLGTSTYDLPDDVLNIRRVTWKGYKVDPLPHREYREFFQGSRPSGRPFWYIFNNIGLNQIRLFPTPNESLASITTDLYGSEIPNRLIVDYYQAPDFATAIIPSYFRRRLIRSYVMQYCFGVEGSGQNIKNTKYFKAKYAGLKARYGLLLQELHNKPRKLTVSGSDRFSYFPGTPMLPMDRFGSSVNTGE